jgi:hypothetical protein
MINTNVFFDFTDFQVNVQVHQLNSSLVATPSKQKRPPLETGKTGKTGSHGKSGSRSNGSNGKNHSNAATTPTMQPYRKRSTSSGRRTPLTSADHALVREMTSSCHLLDTVGSFWILLDTVGYCWILLDTVGYCWILLDTVGYCWILLDFSIF